MVRSRWKPRIRFGVGTLLIAMTSCVGFFAGYRYGGELSDQHQLELKNQMRRQAVYTTVYNLGDLLSVDANAVVSDDHLTPMAELITSTVVTGDGTSGALECNPFPGNKALIVTCTGAGHDEVEDLLEQLRDAAFQLPKSQLLDTARSVIARKQRHPRFVKWHVVTDHHIDTVLDRQFDEGIRHLSDQYGPPNLNASETDSSFPSWIGARRVAVWRQGEGKLYWAVQDTEQGACLVLGWHTDDMGLLPVPQTNSAVTGS